MRFAVAVVPVTVKLTSHMTPVPVSMVAARSGMSREFVDFAMPKHVAPPLVCRYVPGMKYGAHADAALLQIGTTRIRSDISCTIFINDPASYEGGELSIEVGRAVRLRAERRAALRRAHDREMDPRLAELAWGGVTRVMLSSMTAPVLMSH